MEGPELRDQANLTLASVTKETGINPIQSGAEWRERIKIEFYKTYDVMTGIRIAATLGGFFSMMILLVLYKNYCKPSKTLSEEQLNAAVTAAVEEEDRALKAALEATTFYTSLTKQRQSVAQVEAPALRMSPRFSSVGGGYSHLAPPVRLSYLQQRGKSLPGSALRFGTDDGHGKNLRDPDFSAGEEDEEEFDADCDLPDYFASSNYLSVPSDRRLSSITCSSADTSYLERRGSAFEMGLPAPPCFIRNDLDKNKVDEEGPWDFYYPIDIQVIQPTPEVSPAVSVETLYEKPNATCGLQVPGFHDRMQRPSSDTSEIGLAPLASISSLTSLSSQTASTLQRTLTTEPNEAADGKNNSASDSVGSDSVFMDEEIDTEDEVEEFSTDSEFDYGDDYSFCESNRRPVSRCQKRSLQFASFDSYDASIAPDTPTDGGAEKMPRSADGRRASGGGQSKRRLTKTHSEPRTGHKVVKQLPPWIDKGRSGYVPRRQLSVPARRGSSNNTKGKPSPEPQQQLEIGVSSPPSSTDSNTTTSNAAEFVPSTSTSQGPQRDVPSSTKSLHTEKRKRFTKQTTVNEEWGPASDGGRFRPCLTVPVESGRSQRNHVQQSCNLLKLPEATGDRGSCERLNVLRMAAAEEGDGAESGAMVKVPSSRDSVC